MVFKLEKLWPVLLAFLFATIGYLNFNGVSVNSIDLQFYDTYFVIDWGTFAVGLFYFFLALLSLIYQILVRFKGWVYALVVAFLSLAGLFRIHLMKRSMVALERVREYLSSEPSYVNTLLYYLQCTLSLFLLINVIILGRYLFFKRIKMKSDF